MDTPESAKLVINTMSLEDIKKEIGADSLAYLSMDNLFSAVKEDQHTYCAACFNRKYPTPLYENQI